MKNFFSFLLFCFVMVVMNDVVAHCLLTCTKYSILTLFHGLYYRGCMYTESAQSRQKACKSSSSSPLYLRKRKDNANPKRTWHLTSQYGIHTCVCMHACISLTEHCTKYGSIKLPQRVSVHTAQSTTGTSCVRSICSRTHRQLLLDWLALADGVLLWYILHTPTRLDDSNAVSISNS